MKKIIAAILILLSSSALSFEIAEDEYKELNAKMYCYKFMNEYRDIISTAKRNSGYTWTIKERFAPYKKKASEIDKYKNVGCLEAIYDLHEKIK